MPVTTLFVHGAGGGAWEWHPWLDAWRAHHWPTEAIQLTPTPGGVAATRFPDYLDQVLASCAAHTAGVILIGASLGGLLCLKAAEAVPAKALILINPIPPAGTPGWPPHTPRFKAVIPWGNQPDPAPSLAKLPDAPEAVHLPEDAAWRNESGAVMQAAFEGIDVRLPDCPVLVLSGAMDEDVPPGTGAALAHILAADHFHCAGVSHLGALLGRRAPALASLAAQWLATQPSQS